MNSDEARNHEQAPEQGNPVEAIDPQRPKLEQTASPPSADGQEPTLTDELANVSPEEAIALDDLNNRELQPSPQRALPPLTEQQSVANLTQTVTDLTRQEQELRQTIVVLQDRYNQLSEQLAQTQAAMGRLVQEGLSELEQRKQALSLAVEQLERRRERIRAEMRTTFAGVSQDLAIRVQGFKDYLVGSLQDLAIAAEQLDLVPAAESLARVREDVNDDDSPTLPPTTPKFAEQGFQEQAIQIRNILDQYRKMPDYYGPPWQLRRTFEPIHAERVSNWFFSQGGRGALRTMGSRLQNILIASAVMSVLQTLYGDRLRTLVLANTPERLGEWRRGLQDCLGISRGDFGPERGVVLFEEAPALVQKADRLLAQRQLPLIIIDETEDQINLSLLQFPLWLAFAPELQLLSNSRTQGTDEW